MKSISELVNPVTSPTGGEYLVVSRQESGGYQTYKISLEVLANYIRGTSNLITETSNLITEDGRDIALCDGNDTLIAYD